MLIGVVPHRDSVLFIKASDDPATLEKLKKPLEQLSKSIEFGEAEKPKWALPEGWKELEGTGIAMATFVAPMPLSASADSTNENNKSNEGADASSESTAKEQREIRFTVTQLPKPPADEEWPAYLLQNLNRWRKQIGLDETTMDKMEKRL